MITIMEKVMFRYTSITSYRKLKNKNFEVADYYLHDSQIAVKNWSYTLQDMLVYVTIFDNFSKKFHRWRVVLLLRKIVLLCGSFMAGLCIHEELDFCCGILLHTYWRVSTKFHNKKESVSSRIKHNFKIIKVELIFMKWSTGKLKLFEMDWLKNKIWIHFLKSASSYWLQIFWWVWQRKVCD